MATSVLLGLRWCTCTIWLACWWYFAASTMDHEPPSSRTCAWGDVNNARNDNYDGDFFSISLGRHKVSHTGKTAFITTTREFISLLRLNRNNVSDTVNLLDTKAPLFRKKNLQSIDSNDVNKMCKRAWKRAGITESFSLIIRRKLTAVTGRKAYPWKSGDIAQNPPPTGTSPCTTTDGQLQDLTSICGSHL